jgi:MraZ protein
VFVGKHDRSLDDKGRLVLPSAFRHDVEDAGGGVLAPWDRSLALWTKAKFEDVMDQLIDKLRTGEADDDVARIFQSDAVPVQLDAQGRFLVNEQLRQYAGISRDVSVVGQTNHIEIWDAGRFADVQATKGSAEVSSEIRRLRIF